MARADGRESHAVATMSEPAAETEGENESEGEETPVQEENVMAREPEQPPPGT